ncbi:eukaryotic translation initiation factor 2 subunit beta-like [Punica granatum]|uniref:Eukaryotic translation initiation factor 2 subunit beta-like n=1 Tax=Punica granatum TaxID=22663 RepID=A0A6P8D7U1_PUNGR|nr:eukaryotic translation initiation factor 2 subunit beta-like [Punica granatum]
MVRTNFLRVVWKVTMKKEMEFLHSAVPVGKGVIAITIMRRVFNILRENNLELAGDRRRTVMRPLQVLREGTKKTVFVNFMDLCKSMHRQPDRVMAFLLAGSLDGQQRLVVKGRFAPKNFEGILRRYIMRFWEIRSSN